MNIVDPGRDSTTNSNKDLTKTLSIVNSEYANIYDGNGITKKVSLLSQNPSQVTSTKSINNIATNIVPNLNDVRKVNVNKILGNHGVCDSQVNSNLSKFYIKQRSMSSQAEEYPVNLDISSLSVAQTFLELQKSEPEDISDILSSDSTEADTRQLLKKNTSLH